MALSRSTAAFAIFLSACPAPEPDPVIRNGIDLGPIQSFKAETFGGAWGIGTASDPGARDHRVLEFFSTAMASIPMEVLTEISGVLVRARGDDCHGPPEMDLRIDGARRLLTKVGTRGWNDYPAVAHLLPGMHTFEIRFTNDLYEPPGCDRNLYVDQVTFVNASSVNQGDLAAVSMILPAGVEVVDDVAAPRGKAIGFMSEATATGQSNLAAASTSLVLRARADLCDGAPKLLLRVDGEERADLDVESSTWLDYPLPIVLDPGLHTFSVSFPNDRYSPPRCDRNLYLQGIHFVAGSDGG